MVDSKGSLIVTGASRGIGAATARLAAERGYDVCINYLAHAVEARALAAEIRARGRRCIAIRADVSKDSEVDRLFARLDRELAPLAGLVNNAAVISERADFADLRTAAVRRTLDVNVMGYLLCARRAIRRLARSRGGRGGAIVNVSSQAGTFGGSRVTLYAATKAAINAFTVGLAREVAPEGIRVNAVSPGFIDTPGLMSAIDAKAGGARAKRRLGRSVPLGRLGSPREVAAAILWLISDEASYITGAILPVAGGR